KYNVFGGAGRGPDIYGVEPWPFYLLNLALNFNGWFVLAMAAAPLLLAQGYLQSRAPTHATSKQAIVRLATLVSPFYMWLTIFTAQPHKEERFMYPAYPFLCLNAAISLQVLCTWIFTRTGRAQESATSRDSKASTELHDTAPPRRGLAVVACGLLAVTSLNILRSAGMVTAYSAPLKVLQPLQGERNAFESAESAASAEAGMADKHHTVCYGKEWYRFPSSYLLPDGMRAKFIRSEFDGLLPGEFVHRPGDLLHGTSVIPANMNDLNIGDPSKYIDIAHCDYLVDLSLQSQSTSPLEPDYANHAQHWEKVKCLPFMDAERTPTVARILWIPDLPVLPPQVRRAWGEYCLLRRRQSQ
ncbi:mannosyltransferase, partial [Ascosphaera acerosa]